jgi:hypothetical protein
MGWTRPDLSLHDKPVALADIRLHGVRQLLVYCGNADRCRHQARLDADRWSDDVTLGELQPRMVCIECGHVGADVRPDWPIDRKGYGDPHP